VYSSNTDDVISLNIMYVKTERETSFNVPLHTVQVISETVVPVNHLAGTSKTEPNYNKIQLTMQKPKAISTA